MDSISDANILAFALGIIFTSLVIELIINHLCYSNYGEMKPSLWKKNKHYKELYSIIGNNSNWRNDLGDEKNEQSRQALLDTLSICKSIHPDRKFDPQGNGGYLGYIRQLLKVREALNENKYMRACNELLNIVYFYSFSQRGILNSVISLLSEYLCNENYELQSNGCGKTSPIKIEYHLYRCEDQLEYLKRRVENKKSVPEKLDLIDYFVRAVQISIRADPVLISPNIILTEYYDGEIFPQHYCDKDGNAYEIGKCAVENAIIDLTKDAVLIIPPKGVAVMDRLAETLKCGPEYFGTDTKAFCFPAAGLAVICDKKSRSIPEIARKSGTVKAICVDIKPLFPCVKFNGHSWSRHTIDYVDMLDKRIGLLYEAAKLRNEVITAAEKSVSND